uniref:Uncharacterized protein n=1 Tax=Acrobeloides nanus TaxID=290746 RepID=A0A914E5N8_9BILA
GSQSEWAITFGITAALGIISGIVFLIWGSADVQPWSKFSNATLYPPNLSQIYPSKDPNSNGQGPEKV